MYRKHAVVAGSGDKFTDLNKRVDSHDSHVRLTLSIVHEVQINKFLQLQIISLHAVDDIRKQSTAKQYRTALTN